MEMIPILMSKEQLSVTFQSFICERYDVDVEKYLARVENCVFEELAGIGKFRKPVVTFEIFSY